jgi:predicted permease
MTEKKNKLSLPAFISINVVAFLLIELVIYRFFPEDIRRGMMIGAAAIFLIAIGAGFAAMSGRGPRSPGGGR